MIMSTWFWRRFKMTTTVEQLFSKQRQASASDLRDWGWLQTQFPKAMDQPN
jgi:hypothetical protein